MARNRALDEVRRAKAAPMVALPEGFDIAAETESPLEAMEGSDQLRALMACLDQLDGEKREAVLLAYYRGCSREALSRRYGRPVPTIKTWLHRSLIQLNSVSPMTEPDDRDMLAAEYVLGTLDADERASVAARLPGDADLGRAVAAWEDRFAPLIATIRSIAPPPAVFDALMARLFGAPRSAVSTMNKSASVESSHAIAPLAGRNWRSGPSGCIARGLGGGARDDEGPAQLARHGRAPARCRRAHHGARHRPFDAASHDRRRCSPLRRRVVPISCGLSIQRSATTLHRPRRRPGMPSITSRPTTLP